MSVTYDNLIPFGIGETYRFSYKASCVGVLAITVSYGEDSPVYIFLNTESADTYIDFTTTYSSAPGSGFSVIFTTLINDPIYGTTTEAIVEEVSLKRFTPAVLENIPVKEFLTGTTDEGSPVFFRVDTQQLQIQGNPEMYSVPNSVITETERVSQVKVFVSLYDKQSYQLEGTVSKGVSILKFRPNAYGTDIAEGTRTVQMSFRDSSKNRCRIIQTTIITIPTQIDYSP